MKNILFSLAVVATLAPASASAQSTQKFTAAKHNEYGLTYALPKTQLLVSIEAEQTIKTAGPYWKYAKKYLNTTDVVREDSKSCTLTHVQLTTFGVANRDEEYLMQFKNGSAPFILTTQDGRLLSLNTESVEAPLPEPKRSTQESSILENNGFLKALPAEVIACESDAKRAEMIARQIYRLRESRTAFATGEADQMPPDGEALKLIMQQLDEQEKMLTALFVGTTQRISLARSFTFSPDTTDTATEIIARISNHDGIVDASNLSGAPVTLNVKVVDRPTIPVNEKGEAKKLPKGAVIYRIPGRAQFTVNYEGKKVAERNFDISQVGVNFGLDPAMFTDKKLPAYAKFSPITGGVLEIGNKE